MRINVPGMQEAEAAFKAFGGRPSVSELALVREATRSYRLLDQSGVLDAIQRTMQAMPEPGAVVSEAFRHACGDIGGDVLAVGRLTGHVTEAMRVEPALAALASQMADVKAFKPDVPVAAALAGPLLGDVAAFRSSVEAAQQALRSFGGVGLHEQTLEALRGFQAPSHDLAHLIRRNMDAVSTALAGLDTQAWAFGGLGATLAKALEVPAFLRGFKLPTRKDLRRGHRRFLRAAESLAKSGWTFSTTMTAAEVVALAEEDGGLDVVALDQELVEYYGAENGREFRALASRLLKKRRLRAWHELLRESLMAYRRGSYRVVITALLPMIEGLVCEVTGTIQEKGVNPSKHWRERSARPPKGAMAEIQWCATASFLENLWSRSDFGCPAPGNLNRHRVLHGRHPEVGGRSDALRLLSAVDFIAEAARGVESMAKRLERKRREGDA